MAAVVVALAVSVGLLAFLVVGLLRSNAEILRALHRLGVDLEAAPRSSGASEPALASAAPSIRPTPARVAATEALDITGQAPDGSVIALALKGVDHDTLVGFLTSGCATCRSFWSSLSAGPPQVPGGARLVVVTRGPEAESPGAIASLAGPSLTVVMSSAAWEAYDVPYAPYFVFVSGRAGRVVGEGVASTWQDVRRLVADAVADGTTAPPPLGSSLRRRSRSDRERDAAVDRALAEAGISPGDPRLYPRSLAQDPEVGGRGTAGEDAP